MLQTDLTWQTRMKLSVLSVLPLKSFMHPLEPLMTSLFTSSTFWCVLAPSPQVLVPAHIQASHLPYTRHIMDFYTDCILGFWYLFVISGTVCRLN